MGSNGKREHFDLEPLPVAGREMVKGIPEMKQEEFNSRNATPLNSHELDYEASKDKLLANPKYKHRKGEHD